MHNKYILKNSLYMEHVGIPVIKVRFSDRQVEIDFKKIFQVIGKTLIGGVFNPSRSIDGIFDLIDAFSLKPEPSNIAYKLILTSLINASSEVIEDNKQILMHQTNEGGNLDFTEKFVDFSEQITPILENNEFIIDASFFQTPYNIPIFSCYQESFKMFLEIFVSGNYEASVISQRLPAYFLYSLHREWSDNYQDYKLIEETLQTPFSHAFQEERNWDLYFAYLQKQTSKSILGESFNLNQLYIPLRAFSEDVIEDLQLKGDSNSVKLVEEKKVFWAFEHLQDWINNKDEGPSIKIINGGPGSGKSSLCKILAARFAKDRTTKLLFIPLHLFHYNNDISDSIDKFIQQSP